MAASKVSIAAAAQGYGELALQALVDVFTDKTQPAAARISAANAILDRGFGKPTAPVETASEDRLTALMREIGKRGSAAPLSED